MSGLVSVEEARAAVLAQCERLPAVQLPAGDALGCVLAEPVVAGEPVPPFRNSSMDGYAVRSADVAGASPASPVVLEVIGRLMAGDDPAGTVVGRGQAVRIMTGAAVPEGADSVCMVERTRTQGGHVLVEEAVATGTNIRLPGEDVDEGDEIFPAGTPLGAPHVGVLASVGLTEVSVWRRPRVGVVSTGDELRSAPGPLLPGKIRDSNRPGLLARLRADGFEAVDLGWVADEPEVFASALDAASAACDAILTSGGVSVGDADIVKMVLARAASSLWFQVAVRPAKPFAFGLVGERRTPVFGLPGNPVSALVSYELFARPSLRHMAGHRHLYRPVLRALALEAFPRKVDGKLHLARGFLRYGPVGDLVVSGLRGQGSHQLRALADANCLVALPDGEGAQAGDSVCVWLLGEMPSTSSD